MAMMKGGKVSTERLMRESFKNTMARKLAESKMKAVKEGPNRYGMVGGRSGGRQLSKKAELALEEIAKRQAAKEERELRKMVFITPENYPSHGRMDEKGNVYDLADNIVMKVDKKGKVKTVSGWTICKYKPKSMMNKVMITSGIEKHSPYFINQRKIQELQRQQMLAVMYGQDPNSIGSPFGGTQMGGVDLYGRQNGDQAYRNTNIAGGMTAWGAMADNVHGGFSSNVLGTYADNVWGRASTDVWGGFGTGGGGIWSGRGWRIWGSGKHGQKNYLAKFFTILTGRNLNRIRAFFRGTRGGSGGSFRGKR